MENYNIRIQNSKRLIKQADYILIGAGAGLSTAAGLEYAGESFENNYKEYIDKYHFTDLYTATFYNFDTPEEKWAFWAKMIKLNRYNEKPLKLYEELFELVKNKEHFVITTNADGQFEKAGFNKKDLFIVQGDYSLLQCEDGCHDKLYYNENDVNNWLKNTDKDLKIPSNMVPKCPVCGKNMDMNLRKDAYFVQDENWYKQAKMYEEFLDKARDKKMLLIEIGVGFNTPGIIRFPFEQMVYSNLNTTMIRINKDYPMVREEIKAKSISFDENTMEIIEDLI
jgi:NAD-dependent SIR2 family protein deacetylase